MNKVAEVQWLGYPLLYEPPTLLPSFATSSSDLDLIYPLNLAVAEITHSLVNLLCQLPPTALSCAHGSSHRIQYRADSKQGSKRPAIPARRCMLSSRSHRLCPASLTQSSSSYLTHVCHERYSRITLYLGSREEECHPRPKPCWSYWNYS